LIFPKNKEAAFYLHAIDRFILVCVGYLYEAGVIVFAPTGIGRYEASLITTGPIFYIHFLVLKLGKDLIPSSDKKTLVIFLLCLY
jgi:hypothetical protein